MILNRIYLIFIFVFIVHSFAQTDISDSNYKNLFDYPPYYDRIVYSVLSDIDDNIEFALSKTDSLTQIIIEEFKRIKARKISMSIYSVNCESADCEDRDTHIRNCYEIIFPNRLFIKLSQEKKKQLEESTKKNDLFLTLIDTLYEDLLPDRENYIPYITTALKSGISDGLCSIYFSTRKSLKNNEQIILINGTAYRIAKRKDGSTVIRKIGKDLQVQIGSCDG